MIVMRAAACKLHITMMNIAAIDNNHPFEYWITYEGNSTYHELIVEVKKILEILPGDQDVPVSQVFTDAMLTELDAKLVEVGWSSVKSYWDGDFKNRKIVTEFMKDSKLESKRLTLLPVVKPQIPPSYCQEGGVCTAVETQQYENRMSFVSTHSSSGDAAERKVSVEVIDHRPPPPSSVAALIAAKEEQR
jgi:hypothetical protein